MRGAAQRARDAEARLVELGRRHDDAQRLAGMGDYDWHIATDTNRWSDQLFRIYGYEPGAIDPSYDVFLAHVHPDDRERVVAVHERAYATGEPYQMVERIIRADGELRHLLSSGQVVTDATGAPVRIRGTCVDITDRVLAEEAEHRRQQAAMINDSMVQGITAALYALELGEQSRCLEHLQHTLEAARRMMDDLGGAAPATGARGPSATG